MTARLSRDLQSRISIDHVRFQLFNMMNLEGVLVEDQKKDTLLYAGVVQVRITDWFFLKDEAELKYIGLENAVVKLNRTDSVWNYAFLEKYFASSPSGQKKAGIEFNLKRVVMNNVSFEQKDAWVGNDLYARVGHLNLDARKITLTGSLIDANTLELVDPVFQQFLYKGRKPAAPKDTTITNEKAVAALQWNPDNWDVILRKLTITNGRYRSDRNSLVPTVNFFNGQHIDFSKINGSISNLRFVQDTMTAVVDLKTAERSGLIVHNLKSDLRFHPQMMEFNDLYLKTNRSTLSNYFAMRFSKISDMNDFIHAVNMEARFGDSHIASDDLAFFAPQVKNWNRTLFIDGKLKGTVDALNGEDVTLRAGINSSLTGDFSIEGLPRIDQAFIHVEADQLRTNYSDAVTFVPAIRRVTTPNLRQLGAISFSGTYTGFVNDFVTFGTLHTALGTLQTDINMKLPARGVPIYSGNIRTTSFQLGRFINNPQIGNVAFRGEVKGRGFRWNELEMDINGTVQRFQYGDYTYQNITAKGHLNSKAFDGKFQIRDPNADLDLNGLITFSGGEPVFNAEADIRHANLQALQLTKENLSLSGQFDLNLRGRSLSNFIGSVNIGSATLMHNDKRLSFDSLRVSSTVSNGVRTLRFRSNEMDGSVIGQFDLESLPDAFTLFLSRYYPSYIKPPRRVIPNQAFTFDITTGVVEDYIKLIDSRLSGFNNSHISGSLNVAANNLKLDADIPHFSYQQYAFDDVRIKSDGNFERLVINGEVSNAVVSDSLVFPATTFNITAQDDVSNITLNTTANQTINQANLAAQVRTFSNGLSIHFQPSSFVLNGKEWTIQEGGELDFRKNTVVQGSLVLRESNQVIELSTQPSDVGDWSDLHVILGNINIGDFSPFITRANRIEGLLSGTIVLEDPQNRFNVIADIRTDELRVDNDSIGHVDLKGFYNGNSGLITAEGANADPDHQILFDLAIDIKDSANTHTDRITVKPVNYPVKILERFLGNLFSDMQGFLTGKLDIVGEGANRNFIGKGRLRDAGLKVNFTQVFYKIDDTDIELTENSIELGRITLRDKNNKTATVSGFIRHQSFRNMEYRIQAAVDNEPMELFNTTLKDNQQFYGRATGTGSMYLRGPQNDLYMYIEATASNRDSSYITLPPSRSRVSGQASFMIERLYGTEMDESAFRGSETNITYDVNLTATPLVNIEVQLDELTGDIIKGRGEGNIRISAGTSEPLTIRGRYDIHEGYYQFTFQSLFKKPFILRPEANNYIEWTGDPYTARVNFEAIYEAKDVSFAPLASRLSLDRNFNSIREDVYVIAHMTGEMFKPTFTFDIEFPPNSPVGSDASLAFGIQQIEKNENELTKQVTFLIVTNSFAPAETGIEGYGTALNELAYSTISGILFSEMNKRLNQLFSKLLQNNDLTLNFSGALYNRNLIDQQNGPFNINQTDVNISLGKSYFNDRVQITFGGTLDVPFGETDLAHTVQLLPDVSVALLINKSGSLRATFFYNQNQDMILRTGPTKPQQRAGAKLSYRKEFNSLRDVISRLFGGEGKKPKPQPLPADTSHVTSSTNE